MRLFTLILLVSFGAGALTAQEPPPKPFQVAGDVSFVKTGGNTDVTTLGLADRIEWKTTPRLTFRQNFRWDYGQNDDVENANAVIAGLRGDYGLTARLLVFAGLGYDYNLFAGVKRHFEEYAGLGYQVLDLASDQLRFDAGVSLNQEWAPLQTTATDFVAGRLAGDYKHLFSERAYFQQIVEYMPNFDVSDDYRFNTESSLVAPLTRAIAIKIGYFLRYRGEPPAGFGSTDTVFRTGIQISN